MTGLTGSLFAVEALGLPDHFFGDLFAVIIFGVVGIAVILAGYKLIDLALTGIDFDRELVERQNVAVAVVVAAIILGLCYFMASVVTAIIG